MKWAETQGSVEGLIARSSIETGIRKIERREWWLWATAILVTLLLTLGILSVALPTLSPTYVRLDANEMTTALRGLVGLVLLFDIYTIFQQVQIYRIRRRLIEREELFRLIGENAADMIALVDSNGNRLYTSPAYQKVLGYSTEELRSTRSLDQVHPDDRPQLQEAAVEAFRGGAGRRIEYRMRHKNGTWLTLESTANPVRNAAGEVDRLVVVNRDITGRKRLEEQFQQAQKMEAIGRLSGGVAHDFNNLLGVIIGYSEIPQEGLRVDHPLRHSADEVLAAGRRAASLTRQLLALSRQQVLEPKVLDVNVVVLNMESMLRRF